MSTASANRREVGIGLSGWANINFVAVCLVVALFCVVFIRDSFEYSRRPAHLAADASDLKPQFSAIKAPDFVSESLPRAATVQSGGLKSSWLEEKPEFSNQGEGLASSPPFRQNSTAASAPNNNSGVADNQSNSRSVNSSTEPPARAARTTASSSGSSGSSSSEGRTTATRSTTTRRLTSGASIRHSVRRSLANHVRNPGVHNSTPRAARENAIGLSASAQIKQNHSAGTKIANNPGLMSMHTLGGSAVGQIHGATSSMRMESGMLAQPGIGAGLGGINSGLGGGGGIRGGNRVAK